MALGDINCQVCKGRGVVKENGVHKRCEACFTLANREKQTEVVELSEIELMAKLNEYGAPDFTKDEDFTFDASKLLNDRKLSKEIREDVLFETYVAELQTLAEHITAGKKPFHSYYISSDVGYGKSYFIWHIIKSYLKHGKSVSPYLTTEDIIHLKRKSMTDTTAIETLNQFYNNDLIVLRMQDSTTPHKYHHNVIFEVLSKAGHMNRPVIVTSQFNAHHIKTTSPRYERLLTNSGHVRGKYTTLKTIEYQTFNTNNTGQSATQFTRRR